MNTIKFLLNKQKEIYGTNNDNTKEIKKINNSLLNNYKNLTENERDLLFLNNTKLVSLVVNKIIGGNKLFEEELMLTGMLGLNKAIENFKPDLKIEFSSFAYRCIQNEIYMFLRKEKRHLNLSSLDDIIYEENSTTLTLEDTISDNKFNPKEEANNNILFEYTNKIMSEFSEDDQYIINHLFEINGCNRLTSNQIAEHLGISQSYVSRKKDKILKKIRTKLED